MGSVELAGWVQAGGSILAIGAAWLIAHNESKGAITAAAHERERAAEADRQAEREASDLVRNVLEAARECAKSIAVSTSPTFTQGNDKVNFRLMRMAWSDHREAIKSLVQRPGIDNRLMVIVYDALNCTRMGELLLSPDSYSERMGVPLSPVEIGAWNGIAEELQQLIGQLSR